MRYVKIEYISQRGKDYGGLYIRITENRTPKRRTLRIRITKKNWIKFFNEDKQRFKNSYLKSKEYNQIIESNLLKYQNIPLSTLDNGKLDFIKYWKNIISTTHNHGTKIKHETILKKFKKFLLTMEKKEISFEEITPQLLRNLEHYLRSTKDPKGLSNNTIIHYLKVMKSILNKSLKEGKYKYEFDPFNSIELKKEKKNKEVLSKKEITELINKEIDNENIDYCRNTFLFQLFSNGMRVSDLFLLKWKNIVDGRVNYTMFKNRREINLPLNLSTYLLLTKTNNIPNRIPQFNKEYPYILEDKYGFENYVEQRMNMGNYGIPYNTPIVENQLFISKEESRYTITFNQLNLFIEFLLFSGIPYEDKKIINSKYNFNYKGFMIDEFDRKIKELIDLLFDMKNDIERITIGSFGGWIRNNIEDTNSFVFNFLNNEAFKSMNDYNDISIEQYKEIKHKTIVYNRSLKKLQKVCDIDTSITSHISRHSFTNLLLQMDGINLYDISKSLGHSNLSITENYIKSGFNLQKIDDINRMTSNLFDN